MISSITGKIVYLTENCIEISTSGGVGYKINVPTSILPQLQQEANDITVYTYLAASNNEFTLYGFVRREERAIFEHLISVSGVGPKAALKFLSLPLYNLVEAIASEDTAFLTTIPGIGSKTAKRVILELKDKFGDTFLQKTSKEILPERAPAKGEIDIVIKGLQSLGYSYAEVKSMINKVDKEILRTSSAQDIIRICLKKKKEIE